MIEDTIKDYVSEALEVLADDKEKEANDEDDIMDEMNDLNVEADPDGVAKNRRRKKKRKLKKKKEKTQRNHRVAKKRQGCPRRQGQWPRWEDLNADERQAGQRQR